MADGIVIRCPYNQVRQAVTVDVAGTGNGVAAVVIDRFAGNRKAACTQAGKVDRLGVIRLAKDHIAATSIRGAAGIITNRPHNQVRQAVTVDVAGTRDGEAAVITERFSVNHKAACTVSHAGKVGRRAIRLTKDHIAATGI